MGTAITPEMEAAFSIAVSSGLYDDRWEGVEFAPGGEWSEATKALWEALRPFVSALARAEASDSDVVGGLIEETGANAREFLVGIMSARFPIADDPSA
jgi:hypothetical protein